MILPLAHHGAIVALPVSAPAIVVISSSSSHHFARAPELGRRGDRVL